MRRCHLTLEAATGGATLGTPSEADLTILDDGAVIGLGPGGGGWMNEVSLSPPRGHHRHTPSGLVWRAVGRLQHRQWRDAPGVLQPGW